MIQAIIFITSRKLPDYTNLIKIDLFITANDNFAVLNKNNYKNYLDVLHLDNEIFLLHRFSFHGMQIIFTPNYHETFRLYSSKMKLNDLTFLIQIFTDK